MKHEEQIYRLVQAMAVENGDSKYAGRNAEIADAFVEQHGEKLQRFVIWLDSLGDETVENMVQDEDEANEILDTAPDGSREFYDELYSAI